MNAEHAHLILNHLPVVGVLLGFLLLLVALLRRSAESERVALGVLVVTAALAFPAYFSGTQAEDGVEHLAGVTEAVIEAHEEAAVAALVASGILGLAALAALAAGRGSRRRPAWLIVSVLVFGAVAVGLLGRAANLGGQIRHTEIRAGSAPAAGSGAETAAPAAVDGPEAGERGEAAEAPAAPR